MKISEHADHTEQVMGIRGEDVHKWIDGFFDRESFDQFLILGHSPDYDPYDHRKFRHCREALEEAYKEFENKYSREQIKSLFELHIKDDYNGYIPNREDFTNGTFTEKYHEADYYEEPIFSKNELTDYFKGKHLNSHSKQAPLKPHGFMLKIVFPTIIAISLFIISIFTVIIPTIKADLLEAKREMLKELTNTAESAIETFIAKEKSGELSKKEAQQQAIDEIRQIRYGSMGNDYFWITDMHPRMIMHPNRKDLIGSDLTYYQEGENKSKQYLFVEFVKLVEKSGEGYLQYHWQWRADSPETVVKLSYVRAVPHWEWIIGTGIFINDIEEDISRLINQFIIIFTIITCCLAALLTNIVLQSHRIERNRLKAESGLREAKNRYRALVEASNEGYILETGGEHVFTNRTLQRLLGYSEKELRSTAIWKRLLPPNAANTEAVNNIFPLLRGEGSSGEYEAQVKTKSGAIIDVIIGVSSIFFSEKNGHVITFRPITPTKLPQFRNQFNYGSLSNLNISRKVADVCTREPEINLKNYDHSHTISESALTFEAQVKLERSEQGYLTVVNHNNIPVGIIGFQEIAKIQETMPIAILREIKKSKITGHVVQALNQLPQLLQEMITHHAQSDSLRRVIGYMFDAAIKGFIEISIKELGKAPCDFTFISLGSNGRHEMTMFSDQDNALIFSPATSDDLEKTRRYFLQLADRVCSKLNQAGYSFCPGGIMAVNPQYCKTSDEWKETTSGWIKNAAPQSILDINVFFDIWPVYGKKELAREIQDHIRQEAAHHHPFLRLFAENCLLYKVPINTVGMIKTETTNGEKSVNLKECLKPIVNFARLYALKYSVQPVETINRLQKLAELGSITEQSLNLITGIFNRLWSLRFFNQLICHANLRTVNDTLVLNSLSAKELSILQNDLSEIAALQSKLSYDFLGVNVS